MLISGKQILGFATDYTLLFRSLRYVFFYFFACLFFKHILCSPRLPLFDQKHTVKTVTLWNIITIQNNFSFLYILNSIFYIFKFWFAVIILTVEVSSRLLSTVVPSVKGPASTFLKFSFTSIRLSSTSTRRCSASRHVSSICFRLASREACWVGSIWAIIKSIY